MKSNHEVILELWKSHPNYIGKKSISLEPQNIGDYMANLFCPGPSFHYMIDAPSFTLDFASTSMESMLGIHTENLHLKDFVSLIHPDDLDFFARCEDVVAFFLKTCIPMEKMVNYKITYCLRERTASGNYKLFLLQTLTIKTSEKGELLKVFGVHTDISHITNTNNYKLSLIGLYGEPSFLEIDVFDDNVFENFAPFEHNLSRPSFTKRELEILKLLALGLTTDQISEELNISPKTVLTHRRNMLEKFKLKNTTELVANAIRHGYI